MTQCGYVALIGRPNVGKSTLLNAFLGQKISITSAKPQTTRFQILGIRTQADTQTIFIDTPGLHQNGKRALNRFMNRAATAVLHNVDLILWLVTARQWTEEDEAVLQKLQHVECPVVLVINKIDQLRSKAELLPILEKLSQKYAFAAVVPVSARDHTNLEQLEALITQHLPAGPFIFPADQVSDKSERFIAAEIIREQLMEAFLQEIPYAITVEIEQFEETAKLLRLAAIIWVERDGQKAIVIGSKGAQLKEIGTAARLELERWFGRKVYLQLWVKVKENWSDDERLLKRFGYEG